MPITSSSAVLADWCVHVRGVRKRGKTTCAVGYSARRRYFHLGQQQQDIMDTDIMHTEQQSSERGARACQLGAVWEGSVDADMPLRSSVL